MDTNMANKVTEILSRLPQAGAARDLGLRRLAEMYAAGQASAALRRAAERKRPGARPVLADLLSAASALGEEAALLPLRPLLPAASLEPLRRALASAGLATLLPGWVAELRALAEARPGSGACTLASAFELWSWTLAHFQAASRLPEAVTLEMAEAFSWLLAARAQVLEAVPRGGGEFHEDLCHLQAARTSATVAELCAELVFGYRHHPRWDAAGCAGCFAGEEVDALEGVMPGIASTTRARADVVESDGSHPHKAGPCARFDGVEAFRELRAKLDGCLTGARLSKDRAAAALPLVLGAPAAR